MLIILIITIRAQSVLIIIQDDLLKVQEVLRELVKHCILLFIILDKYKLI